MFSRAGVPDPAPEKGYAALFAEDAWTRAKNAVTESQACRASSGPQACPKVSQNSQKPKRRVRVITFSNAEQKRARSVARQRCARPGSGQPVCMFGSSGCERPGAMGASPREAAARRRRGVLARAAYAVRKARRDRAPPLPLAGTSQCGARPAAALASAGDPRRGARSSSPSTSSSRGATAPEP